VIKKNGVKMVKTQTQGMLLYAVTSVHPGSGSEVGFVDLPIQRRKAVRGLPKSRRFVAQGRDPGGRA